MHIKFTSNNDWDWQCESVHLLKDSNRELVKRASIKDLLPYKKTPNQEDLHIIAVGAYEGTGCFFKGAPVQTMTGIKPIEEIKVGELVLTHKGRYRKVTHLFKEEYEGEKIALDITSMCDEIHATANHPFSVIKSEQFKSKHRCPSLLDEADNPIDILDEIIETQTNFVAAKDIEPDDYVLTPINISMDAVVSDYTHDEAYLFGYYLSEGCLTKEYTAQVDKLFGHQSTQKFIHPNIFCQSLEWKLKFLAAYFDGDGSLISDDTNGKDRYIGKLTAATASRNLAYDLQRLLASCGITSSIYKGLNKKENGCFGNCDHVIYQVNVGGSQSNEILKYCLRLQPVQKEFKYKTGKRWISSNYLVLKVKKVTTTITAEIKYNLEVEEDNTYVVDCQGHNSNRNGDCFLEKDCKSNHHYFTKSNRAVHRHHKNKPSDPKYGNIKAAAYNDKMRRIELILGLDKDKCGDILHEQETTGNTNWSMASKQAEDICSWCHHHAKTDKDRCEHIPSHLGEINKLGEMCSMINPDPRWFEISYVKRPADRIGMSLGKMASEIARPMTSSDFLSLYGDIYIPDDIELSKKAEDKRALLKKLAEIEKHVEAVGKSTPITNHDKFIKEHGHKLKHSPNIDNTSMDSLRKMDPSQVLKTLADHGIIFNASDFSKYLFDNRVDKTHIEGMKSHLPHIYSHLEQDGGSAVNSETFEPSQQGTVPDQVKKTVSGLHEGHSLHSGPAMRRMMMIMINLGSMEHQEPTKQACDLEFAKQYATYKLAALNYLNEQGKLDDDLMLNAILQNQ